MQAPLPLTRDLVLIGGGHTHALVLRMWGMNPLPGTRLTLINPGPTAPYSGMLPGFVAGHYQREALDIDLVKLARFAGARIVFGRVDGIDREARLINVTGRAPIFYDVASVDIGITSDLPALEGFTAHAVPAKPLGAFATRWDGFVQSAPTSPRVAVIGAGVAGVELSLAAQHRMEQAGLNGHVVLLEAGEAALRDIGDGARRALLAQLEQKRVELRVNAKIARVTNNGVTLETDEDIAAGFVIGAAGALPQAWLGDTGLQLSDGFIDVGPTLQSLNDPAIFAVGDCAHLTHAPRPKAGVFAVREAPVLVHNLRAALSGGRLQPYHPQKDYLKLISTGHKRAVADKLGLRLEGDWLWRWKNQIDQKFMGKFRELPVMTSVPEVPTRAALGLAEMLQGAKPPCGGCAAKPGAHVLSDGLAGLQQPMRSDVLQGAGDDAAVLRHGDGVQVITADHFRAFFDDPYLMARIAAVHALGDIWAMGAQPQAALATLILPRMRDRMQEQTLREIMAAASEVFREAGADLVGGHTSVGPELTVGFTVTGLHSGAPVGLSGAKPGDVLLLTKPIGSGTIFAAEMQGQARGEDVAAALGVMAGPLGTASGILAPVAHAMTDVTGYGLAGHLLTILRASGVSADLSLAQVPFMQGALELAQSGIRSTLYPDNAVMQAQMAGFDEGDPRCALLLDPQTAGGLLAAVPPEHVDATLAELSAKGVTAVRIGVLGEGPPLIGLG
ncbi:selenide, water dikinase SelD [Actibacterium lipolyticum]|uniref:Selenide, water dikinase n=1 Tax=Actibacterium lipolyticum TaxID=1524263 RepID=A0A238KQ07_9RHOB|nr:selenide, water dikinase SelD [Actibacterium lipolyticum]SMX44944.1 Selenide, water dikinase [Actibacterium lipolyticum]